MNLTIIYVSSLNIRDNGQKMKLMNQTEIYKQSQML